MLLNVHKKLISRTFEKSATPCWPRVVVSGATAKISIALADDILRSIGFHAPIVAHLKICTRRLLTAAKRNALTAVLSFRFAGFNLLHIITALIV